MGSRSCVCVSAFVFVVLCSVEGYLFPLQLCTALRAASVAAAEHAVHSKSILLAPISFTGHFDGLAYPQPCSILKALARAPMSKAQHSPRPCLYALSRIPLYLTGTIRRRRARGTGNSFLTSTSTSRLLGRQQKPRHRLLLQRKLLRDRWRAAAAPRRKTGTPGEVRRRARTGWPATAAVRPSRR